MTIQSGSGLTSEGVITLKVENISTLVGDVVSEEPTYIRNLPWRAKFCIYNLVGKNVGFFLQCDAAFGQLPTWQCKAKATLKLLSQKAGSEDMQRKINHVFKSPGDEDWGFSHFIDFPGLMDPSRGFVENDCVQLQIVVQAEAPTF